MGGVPTVAGYDMLREIGRGGMGIVYEAEDRENGQRVALKTLAHSDIERVYQLKREFRLLADLSHPNLVALYELVVDDDACFYTMELLDGEDLLSHVWRDPTERDPALARTTSHPTSAASVPLAAAPTRDIIRLPSACDFDRLRPVLAQLGRGLNALHAAGRIHRDVKPSNVQVTSSGRVVLLDFGLASEVGRRRNPLDAAICGTVAYMAPEQCAVDGRLTPAADWYALGVVLFQAITGRLPFDGPPAQVLHDKQAMAAPSVSLFCSDVPDDLRLLCDELLERAPGNRPSGASLLARLGVSDALSMQASSTSRDAEFAGRDAELEQLRGLLPTFPEGRPTVAVVRGESGVGKSSLISHFVEQVTVMDPDAVVLRGRSFAREDVPYRAMDGLIDELSDWWLGLGPSDAQSILPRSAWLLPRLFPVLGRVPAIADAPHTARAVSAQAMRTDAFNALREALGRIADRRRLVLVLDDVQWVDRDTTTLLADLMRAPDPPRLMLILGTRTEGSDEVVERARRMDAHTAVVDVGPLPEEVSIALVVGQLGEGSAEVARQLVRESAGSPLFLTELIRLLQRRSFDEIAGKGLETMLAERFDELGEGARALAELVAIAGEPITRRLLGAAGGMTAADCNRHIAHLRAQRIVRVGGSRADDKVEPYHHRVREVLIDGLDVRERAQRHRALATALSGNGAPGQLARHWYGAGEPDRAAEYARRAGDDAREQLDFDRTAGFYRLALAGTHWSAPDRLSLRRALADALADAGQPREAAEEFLGAAATSDASTALELRGRAAGQLLQSGHIEQGLVLTDEVLAGVGLRMPRTPMRALVSMLLRRAWLRLRGLGFRRRDAGAVRQSDMTRVDVCEEVSFGLALVDTFRSMDFGTKFLLGALRLGEPWRVSRALALEADFLAATAKPRRARRLLDVLAKLTPELDHPEAPLQLVATRAFYDFFCTNRLGPALEGMNQSTETHRTVAGRAGFAVDTINLFRSWALYYMGQVRELSRRVPAMAEAATRSGNLYSSVTLRCGFAVAWLARLEAEEIEDGITAALRSWSTPSGAYQLQHLLALSSRIDLALYRGAPDDATAAIEADRKPMRRSLIDRPSMNRSLVLGGLLRHALAMARMATPGSDARRDGLTRARRCARQLRAVGLPMSDASWPVFSGAIMHLEGRDDEAATLWRTALPKLEAIDYHLYAHATRHRLGTLIGGTEGEELCSVANAWLATEGVRDPTAMLRMLLP